MPLPVRRKTTTPAARGGALVFIAACYKKNRGPRPRSSRSQMLAARAGLSQRRRRGVRSSDGEASAKSVRAARRMKRAAPERVLHAPEGIDQASEREFHAFRTLEVGVVAHRQPCRCVAPELGLKL